MITNQNFIMLSTNFDPLELILIFQIDLAPDYNKQGKKVLNVDNGLLSKPIILGVEKGF